MKEETIEKQEEVVSMKVEAEENEVKRDKEKEEKMGMGQCILSLKRMSLQSLGLEPL